MSVVLLNLKSNQEIKLEQENPFIIGRNNVHGCFDKRVSRNHGKITWTLEGKIHLVALHNNPCFFTRNGIPPVLQLIKNEEEYLNEGDCVGLLPDSFWFQIKKSKEKTNEINSNEVNKLENNKIQEFHTKNINESFKTDDLINSEILEQNVDLSTSNSNLNSTCQSFKPTTHSTQSTTHSDSKVKPESSSNISNSTWGLGNPEFEKTRRLPLWMYEVEEPIKNNPNIQVTFRSKFSNSQAAESASKKAKLLDPEKNELSSTSTTIFSPSKLKDNSILESGISASEQNKCSPSKTTSISKEKTPDKNFKFTEENLKLEKKDCENAIENVPVKNSLKRPICLYETNCYRKNAQHKLDFCHPGDEDYIPYEKRPYCQYGESCYRQNKVHKVEFRHSSKNSNLQNSPTSSSTSFSPHRATPPLPAKRKRKTVNQINFYDSEDCDEYDVEDPFINDASSDEYVPSEVDDEMEFIEDTD